MIELDLLIKLKERREERAAAEAAREGHQLASKHNIARKLMDGLHTAAAMKLVLLKGQHKYNNLLFLSPKGWKNPSTAALHAAHPFDKVSKRFGNFVVD